MITLASDFGSPYPAAMRAVLVRECQARLIDVAHDFPRQDVRTAAFWLREILPEFPPAVHLVVVDPGVGTDRAALAVRAGDHALVGPDNGVLVPAARRLAGDGAIEPFEIAVADPASHTFHGRDVFAPAAAEIHAAGVPRLEGLPSLSRVESVVDLSFPEPAVEPDRAAGEVLVVDGFGNAITNVPGDWLADSYGDTVEVDGEPAPARRTYAAVEPGAELVTVGSHGNVELAANRGRGDEAFGVAPGDPVTLTR
ncbi:MAG: S-adenosyl-l-methionine hydroxide adenosyltransferase family protein [Halobacteriales archaeon]